MPCCLYFQGGLGDGENLGEPACLPTPPKLPAAAQMRRLLLCLIMAWEEGEEPAFCLYFMQSLASARRSACLPGKGGGGVPAQEEEGGACHLP